MEEVTVGRLLVRTFPILRANARAAAIALVVVVGFAIAVRTSTALHPLVARLISVLPVLPCQWWVTTRGMSARGLASSMGETGGAWAAIGLILLSNVLTICALFLLLVPGIILFARWAAALPVIVAERGGIMASFERSWALTAGQFWPIVTVKILMLLIAYAATFAFGLTAAAVYGAGVASAAWFQAVVVLSTYLVATFNWHLAIAIYEVVSGRRPGLAETFA